MGSTSLSKVNKATVFSKDLAIDSARWLIRVSTIQSTDIKDWPYCYIYLGGESTRSQPDVKKRAVQAAFKLENKLFANLYYLRSNCYTTTTRSTPVVDTYSRPVLALFVFPSLWR
jgi:hypothetical protein